MPVASTVTMSSMLSGKPSSRSAGSGAPGSPAVESMTLSVSSSPTTDPDTLEPPPTDPRELHVSLFFRSNSFFWKKRIRRSFKRSFKNLVIGCVTLELGEGVSRFAFPSKQSLPRLFCWKLQSWGQREPRPCLYKGKWGNTKGLLLSHPRTVWWGLVGHHQNASGWDKNSDTLKQEQHGRARNKTAGECLRFQHESCRIRYSKEKVFKLPVGTTHQPLGKSTGKTESWESSFGLFWFQTLEVCFHPRKSAQNKVSSRVSHKAHGMGAFS